MSQACGKIILFGEHSILHGGAAVTFPVFDVSLKVEVKPADTAPDAKLLELLARDFPLLDPAKLRITSSIPQGAGMGSSAALCVALHRLAEPGLDPKTLAERAWKSEELFHGKSSGLDPTSIACEKPLIYLGLGNFEILNIDNSDYVLVIEDSGIRRSTIASIQATKGLKETKPEVWTEIIDGLKNCAEAGAKAVKNFSSQPLMAAKALGILMNEAHEKLRKLGVSDAALDRLCETHLEAGALGSKMTGAGRGGCIISLFESGNWRRFQSRKDSGRSLNSLFELRLDLRL